MVDFPSYGITLHVSKQSKVMPESFETQIQLTVTLPHHESCRAACKQMRLGFIFFSLLASLREDVSIIQLARKKALLSLP